MNTYLAFYKGTRAQNPQATCLDRLICFLDGGKYSHCEIAIKRSDGLYDCISSYAPDGGVRLSTKELDANQWTLKPIKTENNPYHWRAEHGEAGYDYLGLLRTKIAWWPQSETKWSCNEACAAIIGLRKPARWGIQELHEWADAHPRGTTA